MNLGFERMLVIIAATLTVVGCAQQPSTSPSVLILSVDTLRADAVGPSRRWPVTTPAIDRLYAQGTSFSSAITPMPRTTPALATMLTGLWTWRHGSREAAHPIHEVPALAELLQRSGWQTAAVSANVVASRKEGLDRGFSRFVGARELQEKYGDRLYDSLDDIGRSDPVGWATATTDEALTLARGFRSEQPFFLWLFYFDPHLVYLPPPPFIDAEIGSTNWQLFEFFKTRHHGGGRLAADVDGLSSSALQDVRRLYLAEIEYLDHEINRLLEGIRERGLLENTVVVFTADHGENLGEEGVFYEHGSNVHDSAIRVPLVFSGPGIAAGRVDSSSVALADISPTLLSLLDIPPDQRPASDGIDLSPRLVAAQPSPPDRERVVFAESATPVWNEEVQLVMTGRPDRRMCVNGERFTLCRPSLAAPPDQLYDHQEDPGLSKNLFGSQPEVEQRLNVVFGHWAPGPARQRTARTSRFKLVQRPNQEGGYDTVLYDLAADPEETTDVSQDHPGWYRRLEVALNGWTQGRPVEDLQQVLSRDDEERLRSLGYLGD